MEISVAITTYNGSKYIIEQLECIRLQTLPPDEVIIVDDCSTDNTNEIVRGYIEHNNLMTWHLYPNKVNVGWKKNTITALTKAHGNLVFYSDQDDIWPYDKIERMYSIVKNNPNCLLLASNFTNFVDGHQIIIKNSKETISKRLFNYKWFYIKKPGAAFAIKKEIASKLKYFYSDNLPTDQLLWHLAMIEDGLYVYDYCGVFRRCHSNNATREDTHEFDVRYKYAEEAITYIKKLGEYYQENYRTQNEFTHRTHLISSTLKFKIKQVNFFTSPSVGKWIALLVFIPYYSKIRSWITDGKVLFEKNELSERI